MPLQYTHIDFFVNPHDLTPVPTPTPPKPTTVKQIPVVTLGSNSPDSLSTLEHQGHEMIELLKEQNNMLKVLLLICIFFIFLKLLENK